MWGIAGILLIALLIIIFEVPSLWKSKQKKELWVFFLLLIFGVGLSIAKSLAVNIPNPLDWIIAVYKPFSDAMMNILK
ncbi:hypothetical protein [Pseudalkalibacillus decolorationis]|uniref:hypothetical protein n=1 Tax=Pseudalkalibacillus decolorationis TaxID=163879 RepID=UPI0021479A18|nr:hypothetical protein [Pseudalkalibacillus decolorationis]